MLGEAAGAFPLSLPGGWGDSEGVPLDGTWGSYGSVPLGRLNAIFANAGAGGDGNGDVESLGCFKVGGGGVGDLAVDCIEAVKSTCCARCLVAFLSRDESTWWGENSFFSLRSPGSRSPKETLLPVFRSPWKGSTSREGAGIATGRGCVVSCMELVDEMEPGLVIASRRAARAPFGADISDDLGEDMGCVTTLRVLSTPVRGYSGRSSVRTIGGSTIATRGLTWPTRDRASASTPI